MLLNLFLYISFFADSIIHKTDCANLPHIIYTCPALHKQVIMRCQKEK